MHYVIMLLGVVGAVVFVVAVFVAFRMSAQSGAEALKPFISSRSSISTPEVIEQYVGGLRVALSFGSIFYPPLSAKLLITEDRLILTPSIFLLSVCLPTWAIDFKNIPLIENTGDGIRVFASSNSEAFTFVTSRYLEILQELNKKSVTIHWDVIHKAYWTGKRHEQ